MNPPLPSGGPSGRRFVASVTALPGRLLVFAIRLYQRTLSPLLPVVSLGGCGCRFSPTCSHYAAEAIRRHGAIRGAGLAFTRLLKCTPLHPGGFDPVPATLAPRATRPPVCRPVRQA